MMKKRLPGSITSYVVIMFGLIAVCYLMGFSNMWTQWNATDSTYEGLDKGITDPDATLGLFSTFASNPIYLAISAIVVIVTLIIAKLAGASGMITFVIPLILLIFFANIFIFPIVPMTEKMSWIPDSIPIVVIMIAFFNLWVVLGIIEWVRG